MRKILLLVLVLLVPTAFAADIVPLSTNLKFDALETKKAEPITLVVSQELAHLVIQKKMRLMRLEFPLGNAVATNTETALRSAFQKVKLAR
ncbi:MAG TPA: hypothetical protein VHK90_12030, partial [Thermoanaerobaculia bacterium]|nr:hypothetical protein [Thermoanaerobaculia bacterium]